MKCQYKLIVYNKALYKEYEIDADTERVRIGTSSNCEFRLSKDSFFSDFSIELKRIDDIWYMDCDERIYFNRDDMIKRYSTELSHGDVISVCYGDNGNKAFDIRFVIDFNAKNTDYNWCVELGDRLEISSEETGDIILHSHFGEEAKLLITKHEADYYVDVLKTTYGVQKNISFVEKKEKISDYDFISVGEFQFFYKDGKLYFDLENISASKCEVRKVVSQTSDFAYPLFNRNTRVKNELNTNDIEVLDPPAEPKKPQNNFVMHLIPAIVMLVLVIVIRGYMNSRSNSSYIIFSVCTMSMGIITSIVSYINSGKQYKKDSKKRIDDYTSYIEKKREYISNARQEELDTLNDTFYSLEKDIEIVDGFDSNLFNRIPSDDDFLMCNIGKGDLPSKRSVTIKSKETFETKDDLNEIPEMIRDEFSHVYGAPVTANLHSSNAIGIVGNSDNAYELCKNMIVDISIRQYYGDVKIFALIDEFDNRFEWIRHLPHLENGFGRRNIVNDVESKNFIFEYLFKELSRRSESKNVGTGEPHFVIFVFDEHGIKNHPVSQYVSNAAKIGVTFIFVESKVEDIPLNCDEIIELYDDHSGIIYSTQSKVNSISFVYPHLSDEKARDIAIRLSPVYCEEISLENSLRKNITLYELMKIYDASDIDLGNNWSASKIYETMDVPLGINAKEEVVSLNLHEKFHGPHGLVAGTTGSGKSEILQSYILSAASIFHPYELGFVIIDFKGGGMVNQFRNLPHLVGAITNIDGKEIDRSLKSIKAELLKRQNLFASAEVNHIDKYIQLYKEGKQTVPLPHLIIIVDEFAELKAEQPEFMKELISAARIGRSLGVHLILATQKPAGQVNEQIWSNSKFKLCLKVQTKEDSNEVLKSPLAAEIREPGRAYLQVGNNEIFELFQSAYSGGPAVSGDDTSQKKYQIFSRDFNGKKSLVFEHKIKKGDQNAQTELEAIVDHIHNYCDNHNIHKLPNICLPALADMIEYEASVVSNNKDSNISIGIYDDPDNQYQGQLFSDIGHMNTIIVGASQMGKTNFIQLAVRNLAFNNSPDEVSMYIMDFGSMVLKQFDGLKHVGGVVFASEDEKVKNLFKLILLELDSRKKAFMNMGVSSFDAFKDGGGKGIPRLYLFIENFGVFRELYIDKYEAEFLKITRDGLSLGISVIVTTATLKGFGYKFISNFENRICLPCADSSEYSTAFDRCRIIPKNTPGRMLVACNKMIYESQMYLAFSGEKEIDRVGKIREFIEDNNEKYLTYKKVKLIPEIPELLSRKMLDDTYVANTDSDGISIGLDFATINSVSVSLTEMIEFALVAKKKSKVIPFLVETIGEIIRNGASELHIIDDFSMKLKAFSKEDGVINYTLDVNDIDGILRYVAKKLSDRKTALISGDENETYKTQVIVINSKDAMETISNTKPLLETFNTIVKSLKYFGILVIYGDVEDETIPFGAPELFKRIKESKKGLLFDDVFDSKIYDFGSQFVRDNRKQLESDEAYWINGSETKKVKLVSGT